MFGEMWQNKLEIKYNQGGRQFELWIIKMWCTIKIIDKILSVNSRALQYNPTKNTKCKYEIVYHHPYSYIIF